MLFNEVYGSYYNVVAKVLEMAVQGDLTDKNINDIVFEKAFGESILNIPSALKSEDWKLINSKMETPLKNIPTMPLTILQKQWLRALMNDPRIKLFNPSFDGLEDVEPLYNQNTIEYFDRYLDGDDFENPDYIKNFHCILEALKAKRKLSICFKGHKGGTLNWVCIPQKLEYSSKDDKFRLIGIEKTSHSQHSVIINLARIISCELLDEYLQQDYAYTHKMKTIVMILTDERNALERVMLHFSHLEKETEKLDDKHYRITLKYDKDDETEILIRILSFGPMVRVISPDSFIEQLKRRINRQQGVVI